MVRKDEIQSALSNAWHEETARNSIERWLKICEQEHWHGKPANLQLLVRIFGSSWYFTRFIFSTGTEVVGIIDQDKQPIPDRKQMVSFLLPSLEHDDLETRTNHLRVLKNTCMLKILVEYLQARYTLEQLEFSLTLLGEATLQVMVLSLQMLSQHEYFPVTILAMGRMAGYEMTFGSDLDLIFLYEDKGEELHDRLGRSIRLLLRTIAQPTAAGSLYDVDMRLRPHGNAGPLVTSYQTFVEYHAGYREVWEKQMMTRCRPVLKSSDNVEPVLQRLKENLYIKYDMGLLQQEILAMRTRVQKELGSPRGRYEIKRGFGGIMDIDFITHYYQLGFGYQYEELHACSTRHALVYCGKLKLIDIGIVNKLNEYYNYLKKVELCLRLFDLKSIDSFKTDEPNNVALSRSMGHGNNTRIFLEEYESVTHAVRNNFQQLLV